MGQMTSVRLPGLADVHVHLRVPGGEHKEDLRTGTAAALAGGFTSILAMPNTRPPLVTAELLRATIRQAREEALCDVGFFAGASPDHLDQLPALAALASGLKVYLDQTYGPLRVTGLDTLTDLFRGWESPKPVALHAEGPNVALSIGLAATYGRRVHLCHISRAEEIAMIADAKSRGLPVTCEVTPHHLYLTSDDAARLGSLGDMRPRLACAADVAALWAHLDSTIDCIATDHAPHTLAEKSGDSPPPGVPGLETALPLMLTAVADGRLTLERLTTLMAENPRRIFGLAEQPETWVEVDLEDEYFLPERGYQTRCDWSPFAGMRVKGRVRKTVLRGRTVFDDGAILV
jgi:carbamoyl-phosphate synthase/aspartate carbamoyltransferase/dihydroorotase